MVDISAFLPRAPDWVLSWDSIEQTYPWIGKLRGSIQDPIHHRRATLSPIA